MGKILTKNGIFLAVSAKSPVKLFEIRKIFETLGIYLMRFLQFEFGYAVHLAHVFDSKCRRPHSMICARLSSNLGSFYLAFIEQILSNATF
jgi:hypothetical protein